MNGPHDLGGRAGFGPVQPETPEPVFHAEWEKRALGLTLCCGALGHWGIDESRHARESLPPVTYYTASYYEIWLRALETLLVRHGEVGLDELAAGAMLHPGKRPERKLSADRVAKVLSTGGPVARDIADTPRFVPGDRVRTSGDVPKGHSRIPSYARDKIGTVLAARGTHVFPPANAHGQGEQPQWLYTVEFDGATLWGAGAEPGTTVTIDAWESTLAPL